MNLTLTEAYRPQAETHSRKKRDLTRIAPCVSQRTIGLSIGTIEPEGPDVTVTTHGETPPIPLSTVDLVERVIARDDDATLRNLQITQSYHDLSQGIAALVCGRNANWCTFATWASKQAGAFIRNEEIPAPVTGFLGLEPGGQRSFAHERHARRRDDLLSLTTSLLRRSWFLDYIGCTVGDVSRCIAEGNLRVYAELGPIFARFLQTFDRDDPRDPRKLDGFLATLKPGATEDGGQDGLVIAFQALWDAMYEEDPCAKAQKMLLHDARVGLHEQIRLQNAIAGSLNAPVETALLDEHRHLLPFELPMAFRRLGAKLAMRFGKRVIAEFESAWRHVATEFMMTLALPDGTLSLGEDLPPLAGGKLFPDDVATPTDAALLEVVSEWDPTPGSLQHTGAHDWADLKQRMHYIIDLFRSRLQHTPLFGTPFTGKQTGAIRAGFVPAGKL